MSKEAVCGRISGDKTGGLRCFRTQGPSGKQKRGSFVSNTAPTPRREIAFSNKELFRLIWPLIIEQFLAIAVGLADSVMVARVGESAVSAVSLVDTINVLLINAFTALAAGGAVVSGQYIGRVEWKKANNAAEQLLVFMGVLSLAVTGVLYAVRNPILHGLFGAIEPDVMAYANTYFVIVEASIPFMALYAAGAAIFRVMGDSGTAMRISLLVNGINLAGNALLIYGLHREVEGVAIPTLVSRMVGAVVVLALLSQQLLPLHISRPFRYRYDAAAIRSILRLGVPGGIESSLFQLGKILLLSTVSGFGTAAIAANAIGNTMASFQVLAASSVGVGMVTVISQCVGAGDYAGARRYTRRLMAAAYLSMLACCLALFLLQPLILQLYHVSDTAAGLANRILWMHGGFGVLLWPAAFTLPQALKAAGDTRYVMWVAVGSMWVFRILFGIWFAHGLHYGVLGIWMAMFIDWTCRILFFVPRYRSSRWESKALKE